MSDHSSLDSAHDAALACIKALEALWYAVTTGPWGFGAYKTALAEFAEASASLGRSYPEAREELLGARREQQKHRKPAGHVSVCGYDRLFALEVVQTFVEHVLGILGPLRWEQEDYETAGSVLKLLPPERFSELDKLEALVEQEYVDGVAVLCAETNRKDTGGWWSPRDLAKKYDLDQERLRKRLARWRHENGEGWMEVPSSERRPRDPKFLFRLDAVKPVIDDMSAG